MLDRAGGIINIIVCNTERWERLGLSASFPLSERPEMDPDSDPNPDPNLIPAHSQDQKQGLGSPERACP